VTQREHTSNHTQPTKPPINPTQPGPQLGYTPHIQAPGWLVVLYKE